MRSAVWALTASTVVIASCGGGGGGGDDGNHPLIVSLTYPNDALSLYQTAHVQPQFGGFEGHAANCALVNGSLPRGLTLGSDCVISGRPLESTRATFTARVGASGVSNTLDVSGQVNVQGPLVQYPMRNFLQALSIGETVSDVPAFLNWTAAPDLQAQWSYTLAGGALPAGLALDPATGRISGTVQAQGAFTATIQSTLTTQFGTYTPVVSQYVVNVNVAPIGYTSNPNGGGGPGTQVVYIGEPATLQPVAYGMTAPGTTIVDVTLQGTLPPGLTLNAATGVISGTPAGPELHAATDYGVQATLSNGSASAATQGTLSLLVSSPVHYVYSGGQALRANQPFALVPTQTVDGPLPLSPTLSVTHLPRAGQCDLPPGVTLDAATGVLSGTPTATGNFACSIDETVTNGGTTWTQTGYVAVTIL